MTLPNLEVPYWRLSAYYFLYFASVGAILPYWGLYLRALGCDAAQIGMLIAILVAARIVAPNIWGFIADRSGRHLVLVRVATLLAAVAFAGLSQARDFVDLAAYSLIFGFFWSAALPQLEVATLAHLHDDTTSYTHIRLWGSVGFIVAVMGLGALLEKIDISDLPIATLGSLCLATLVSFIIPERKTPVFTHSARSMGGILRDSRVIALFVICLLIQASHGVYYTFYSIFLTDHGYSNTLIGELWALGVVAEIVIFIFAPELITRVALKTLLLISIYATVIRWILIATFVDVLQILAMAQLLHAASFGIYHAAMIQYINRYFVGNTKGRGLALYSSLSFGVGGAVGSYTAGFSWMAVGPGLTFVGASVVSALAVVIAWRYLDPKKNIIPDPVK